MMSGSLIHRLNTAQEDFAQTYRDLLQWDAGDQAQIEKVVADILAQVKARGDAALIDYTTRFDHLKLTPDSLTFTKQEIESAIGRCSKAELAALDLAVERIRSYHVWQMPRMGVETYLDSTGTLLGQRLSPLQRAGLYVPGGLASYPSSVLMNAIPAKVAGVSELAMVVPTPHGEVNPLILAAAQAAGVDEIYKVGGAQAIAALAYGTQSIAAVDKIVGPGNIYVATAKKQVFGRVGIDMIAGPSEILIVADGHNDPRWLAADLLSQAEHDEIAQSILITDSSALADQVEEALAEQLAQLSRREICKKALSSRGAIILVKDMKEACELASQAASEHLELAVENPEALLPLIKNAGAIFMGRYTPEPIGDYIAGPNHVLPTEGTARFSSPLGVFDFIKRTSLIQCTPDSLAQIGPAASQLADSEGLTAHKLSVDLRLEAKP
ncbi:MAG: histidinol dehydrogenase [Magnetococcales bacterium]|nr:histidinol dehydrogenase [Magnetococcales bacterium]